MQGAHEIISTESPGGVVEELERGGTRCELTVNFGGELGLRVGQQGIEGGIGVAAIIAAAIIANG